MFSTLNYLNMSAAKHKSSLRILVSDFSGHPFQVQLARWFAAQGHEVVHTYCASFQTPRGGLSRRPEDPDNFRIEAISNNKPFKKYNLVSRWRQETEYGVKLISLAEKFNPDVFLSSNAPLGAHTKLIPWSKKKGIPYIFWLQDIYGFGIRSALKSAIPIVGGALGSVFAWLERRMWVASDYIITIADDFSKVVEGAGVPQDRITHIPNWAPLEELPVKDRKNQWSQEHGLDDKCCILYSGTLGLKHNPALLVHLAEALVDKEDVMIVVNSEGLGADYLHKEKESRQLDNLKIQGFQPFDRLPEVLATGDILVTLLEDDAGRFSVPSKVLSYLCVERPLLLALPSENLAARTIHNSNAGLTIPPNDVDNFIAAAIRLIDNPSLRRQLAANGRRYAEDSFDIDKIGTTFQNIINKL